MAVKISFQGNPLTIKGEELKVGQSLPQFRLVGVDMKDLTNTEFANKVLIISAVPSLDTPVCQIETKRFNQEATGLGDNVRILTVSLDLPFAQKRWCGAEGISHVVTASDYKYRSFGTAFGTYIEEMGLLARAVFIADKAGTIRYVEYVGDIASEPDYKAILQVARELAH